MATDEEQDNNQTQRREDRKGRAEKNDRDPDPSLEFFAGCRGAVSAGLPEHLLSGEAMPACVIASEAKQSGFSD